MIDNVSYFRQPYPMRDDIHKKVPRPYRVQEWVKRAVNDADRLNGRSLGALNDAILDVCNREVSEAFRCGLVRALEGPPGLFGALSDVESPRDVGSRGGHFEAEILSEAKRLLAAGCRPDVVHVLATGNALDARIQSDIRATAPVLMATRDPKARIVLGQMQADAGLADCGSIARDIYSNDANASVRNIRPRLSADEDLRGVSLEAGRP